MGPSRRSRWSCLLLAVYLFASGLAWAHYGDDCATRSACARGSHLRLADCPISIQLEADPERHDQDVHGADDCLLCRFVTHKRWAGTCVDSVVCNDITACKLSPTDELAILPVCIGSYRARAPPAVV